VDHDEESGAKGASHPMGRLAMAGKYSRLEVTGEGANVLKGNGRGAPRPYLLVAFAMVEKPGLLVGLGRVITQSERPQPAGQDIG
jgi:hypothetical protein